MYDRTALEQAFSGSERSPRIQISLPHFLALPSLLEHTDLTAIVPRPLARSLTRIHPLSTYELPYETTPVDVGILWHERNAGDAPQAWLREMVKRSSESLRVGSVEFSPPIRSNLAASCLRVAEGV
jgi:DNA-binding transcriptional LysR family regulator